MQARTHINQKAFMEIMAVQLPVPWLRCRNPGEVDRFPLPTYLLPVQNRHQFKLKSI
jgi:hypothetical protein